MRESGEHAKKRYAAKYNSETIAVRFEQSKEVALKYQGAYIPTLFELRSKIKGALENSLSSPNQLLQYFYFGEQAVKLRKQWSGMPLYLEAALKKFAWQERGLESGKLDVVLKIAGIHPSNLPVFAGGAGGDVNVIQWGGTVQTGFDFKAFIERLNVDLDTLASELTLTAIKNLLPSALDTDALKVREQNPLTSISVSNMISVAALATETTLGDIKNLLPTALDSGALKVREQNPLTTIDIGNWISAIDVDNFPSGFNVNNFPAGFLVNTISGFALESGGNLATLAGKDFATQTTLAVLAGKDFATQTTLAEIALDTDNLATLVAKDFATQTTLASILTKLDVALSTRAIEAGGNLATIAGKDFATQTTLALIKAKTDNLDVALSTRALEAGGNLASLVTGINNQKWGGTALTGRDISLDLKVLTDTEDTAAVAVTTIPKAKGKTTIFKWNQATNTTVTIYTVTAGKTFYLVGATLQGLANASSVSQVVALNAAGATLIGFALATPAATTIYPTNNGILSLAVPMPFPAGTVFQVYSGAASLYAYASIIGWEE